MNNVTMKRRLLNESKQWPENFVHKNKILCLKKDGENLIGAHLYFTSLGNMKDVFFEIIVDYEYPFSPPKVIFHTNDGKTRMNPNFYISGKVCLSVLNTWRGEGWTSCQSIRSILLILSTTLNEKPLLNEPGITETHRDFANYQNMIAYKNIDVSIIGIMDRRYFNDKFAMFRDIIQATFEKNHENIIVMAKNLETKIEDNTIIAFPLYSSKYLVDFKGMFERLKIKIN